MTTTIQLTTEFIPLAALLKLAGAAESGGHAKQMVIAGRVSVNGETNTRRSSKIRPGDVVKVAGDAAGTTPVLIEVC